MCDVSTIAYTTSLELECSLLTSKTGNQVIIVFPELI